MRKTEITYLLNLYLLIDVKTSFTSDILQILNKNIKKECTVESNKIVISTVWDKKLCYGMDTGYGSC